MAEPKKERFEVNALIDEINDRELIPVPITLTMLVKILPKGSVITIEKRKFIRFNITEVVNMYNQRLDNREATRQRDLVVFSRDKLLEWLVAEELYDVVNNKDYIDLKGPSGQRMSLVVPLGTKIVDNIQTKFKNKCMNNKSVKYQENIVLDYLREIKDKKKSIYENYIDKNNFYDNMVEDTKSKIEETNVNDNPKGN